MSERGRPRQRRGPRGRLAGAVRAARAARGWTQAEAASQLGVARETLARWETGSAKPRGLALRFLEEWAARARKETDDAA